MRNTIKKIQQLKNKRPISCLTAYSSSISKIVDEYVDIILVGDSLGNAVYGMKNTQSVTLDMMRNHGKAVFQSSKKALTIIDMPYNSYQNTKQALNNAKNLLKYTKCQLVKLEIDKKKVSIISHLVKNNIPVVSHIGVLPQQFSNFNKIKILGKTNKQKKEILDLAYQLENAGSSFLLLECIDKMLAKEITKNIKIPTIGIGSSVHCDGQILVINDILNIDNTIKKPKFVKTYTNLSSSINKSVKQYVADVKNRKFPK